MALTLYFHPLASYCQKVLIALYENDTAFSPRFVDLGDPASAAELKSLWPIGKFPVLRDDAREQTIAESSIIIEYLSLHYPGRTPLLPSDPDQAWQTRLRDRFFDLHVHEHMQRIVGDRLRPAGSKDPYGVEQARTALQTAYGMLDREMANKTWAMGDAFTMADCAATPALFYADKVMPFGATHKNLAAYFARLMARPSYVRVLKEAQPYMHMFPQ
jgi:glutathione S-transferase